MQVPAYQLTGRPSGGVLQVAQGFCGRLVNRGSASCGDDARAVGKN